MCGPRARPPPGGPPISGQSEGGRPASGRCPSGRSSSHPSGCTEGPSRASATGWDCSGPPGDESTGTFHEPVTTCAAHNCRVAGAQTHTQWTLTFKSILQWGPKFAFHPSDMGLLHSGHRDTGTESKPRGHMARGTQSHGDTEPRGHTATRTHSYGDMETWGQIQSHRHSHMHTSGQAQPLRSPICHPKGNVRGILS